MRPIILLVLLACGAAGCTAPAEQRADTPAVSPQPQPGSVTARMGGQFGWYGAVRSQNP